MGAGLLGVRGAGSAVCGIGTSARCDTASLGSAKIARGQADSCLGDLYVPSDQPGKVDVTI